MYATVNENLKPGETSTIHRFERAGLGKAPFTFTGKVTENVFCTPGGTPRAGSSCDCIHKAGDRGLIQQIAAAERKLRDAKNAAARERKHAKLVKRVAEAKEKLPTVRGTLAEQPHPNTYYAEQGRTLLDYVNWCLENGAGEKAAAYIERA
jgi:hypothetical protein